MVPGGRPGRHGRGTGTICGAGPRQPEDTTPEHVQASITKFLIASLGILMTGLFVAVLILAVQAWSNFALAGRIARLTSTDHTLFNALVTVRAQIPKDSTALIAQDEPRLVMQATHREASLTVTAALEALQATDIADRAQFVAAIRSAWAKRKRCNSR